MSSKLIYIIYVRILKMCNQSHWFVCFLFLLFFSFFGGKIEELFWWRCLIHSQAEP